MPKWIFQKTSGNQQGVNLKSWHFEANADIMMKVKSKSIHIMEQSYVSHVL